MRYLLDTCVISDFIKGDPGTQARLRQLPPIGPYDVLIAATALQHQLIMVAANQREFDRVPGLQTENWRNS